MATTKTIRDSQRGVSRSAEWAVLMPVFLGVVFGVIVIAITTHGRAVAQQAAAVGAEYAAFYGASPADGQIKAKEFAERSGLRQVESHVTVDGALVTVTVQARVPNPFGDRYGQVNGLCSRIRESG